MTKMLAALVSNAHVDLLCHDYFGIIHQSLAVTEISICGALSVAGENLSQDGREHHWSRERDRETEEREQKVWLGSVVAHATCLHCVHWHGILHQNCT